MAVAWRLSGHPLQSSGIQQLQLVNISGQGKHQRFYVQSSCYLHREEWFWNGFEWFCMRWNVRLHFLALNPVVFISKDFCIFLAVLFSKPPSSDEEWAGDGIWETSALPYGDFLYNIGNITYVLWFGGFFSHHCYKINLCHDNCIL